MKAFTAVFFVVAITASAQTPEVPHKMQFAGMTLSIRDDARREIQKDVDALTQSPRHFMIKVERARTYFPIIEKVFQEENVPEDFKYLVIQESSLISDAVSPSNAVGFWQFKDYTALEMGLRVDKEVDERLNIVSSSRAAARYMKKNNFYFNNWIYALQAYQMGAGAVLRSVKESQSGARHMEITSSTYWYVKKYLAHKVAFEGSVSGVGQIQVMTYETKSKKSLTELAKEVSIDEVELKAYNKWAKAGVVPDDRLYAVMIPVKGGNTEMMVLPASAAAAKAITTPADVKAGESKAAAVTAKKESRMKINGISVIEGNQGETPTQLASRAGVDLSGFLKWNDISVSDRIESGQYYLLGKKRVRAETAYHTVRQGDNLWRISQLYGLQIKKLKRYNRIDSDRELQVGMTLWLTAMRPKDAKVMIAPVKVVEIDQDHTFGWEAEQSTAIDSIQVPATLQVLPLKDTLKTVPVNVVVDSSKTLQPINAPLDSVTKQSDTMVVTLKPEQHVVQTGETLYAIAHRYNVGVMDLVNWNNLNLQVGIRPGQILKLSESQPVAVDVETSNKPTQIEHEVKSTDTLYSIARKYGVTIKEIMEWNDKKDFTLSVGEKLKVIQK
ncbi:MAG TPA: LysM peptidoglycan-binding domain-containing protein [Ohtaekwangia sp.]